jgi:hypothetical protein
MQPDFEVVAMNRRCIRMGAVVIAGYGSGWASWWAWSRNASASTTSGPSGNTRKRQFRSGGGSWSWMFTPRVVTRCRRPRASSRRSPRLNSHFLPLSATWTAESGLFSAAQLRRCLAADRVDADAVPIGFPGDAVRARSLRGQPPNSTVPGDLVNEGYALRRLVPQAVLMFALGRLPRGSVRLPRTNQPRRG